MRKANTREKEIKNLFLSTLPAKGNDNNPFLICVIGLPGVGKSYLAKIIAKKLDCYIFTSDKVRRLLNNHGYIGKNPDQGLVEYICAEATRYLLKNKINHIMDADSIKFVRSLKRKSKRAGVTFILIRVFCSEQTALERILHRNNRKDSDNFSLADEKIYKQRRILHERLPKNIFYTFDTEKDISTQTNEFIAKLNSL